MKKQNALLLCACVAVLSCGAVSPDLENKLDAISAKIDLVLENQRKLDKVLENQDEVLKNQEKLDLLVERTAR